MNLERYKYSSFYVKKKKKNLLGVDESVMELKSEITDGPDSRLRFSAEKLFRLKLSKEYNLRSGHSTTKNNIVGRSYDRGGFWIIE